MSVSNANSGGGTEEFSGLKEQQHVSSKILDCDQYHGSVLEALRADDPSIHDLITKEYERLSNSIQLIAAENQCSRAVLAALGSVIQNKTMEGFVGRRFHGGSEVVDQIETLAVTRAKEAFEAKYANVQPHSGTQANQIVITAVLERGDTILSLGMDQGGHVSHGANLSFSGKFFHTEHYCVDRESYLLDYEAIEKQAQEVKPGLIICGASAYSRVIDFERFRRIADSVGAYLLADVSHIAALIIAGAHPSPVDHAHFTTSSTYKPGGPRGGCILMGKDAGTEVWAGSREVPLWRLIEKTTFPGVQGTPYLNHIAAKAVFFREALSAEFRERQLRVVDNAKALAEAMAGAGYHIVTGGTDNHMLSVDLSKSRDSLTGKIAQNCLEQCGIVVNMNMLPYDSKSASVTSGIRLGTPIVTRNGMGPEQMRQIAGLIDTVLSNVRIVDENDYTLPERVAAGVREKVGRLCGDFPVFT